MCANVKEESWAGTAEMWRKLKVKDLTLHGCGLSVCAYLITGGLLLLLLSGWGGDRITRPLLVFPQWLCWKLLWRTLSKLHAESHLGTPHTHRLFTRGGQNKTKQKKQSMNISSWTSLFWDWPCDTTDVSADVSAKVNIEWGFVFVGY